MDRYLLCRDDRIETILSTTPENLYLYEWDGYQVLNYPSDMEIEDPSIYYLVSNAPKLRPPLAATVDGLMISGVPEGAVLTLRGNSYICDGTDITLDFNQPGTYTIRIECWPYLDKEFVIDYQP